ncbi:MAG: glycosyltransferase family 4 protein, partial [Patescibacteria group bacterium]
TLHALFQNYDVIHYQAPGPSSLSWIIKLLRPGVGLVATFNSRDSQHQKWGVFAQAYLNLGEWIISKVPDRTLVVSQTLKEYVRKKFQKNPILVHNGSSVIKTQKRDALQRWNLEQGKYFLSVSRLIRHKGIHHLITAFSLAQQRNRIPSDFKLVIVGEGSYTDDYVSYIKELGKNNPNIIFAGSQSGEDLAQFYLEAYAFIQPSEAEGLSNSLLEAMGYGVPVIVSDIPENTIPVNNNGLIFKKKSVEELEAKLVFSLENNAYVKKLSQEAQKYIQNNYSWEENAQKTIKIYEDLLLQKRGYFGRPLLDKVS